MRFLKPTSDSLTRKQQKRAKLGWPGHRLVVNIEAHPQRAGVMLVPATYWHLDLGPACFATNIFLHPDICCQFPKRLFYLDDLYTPSWMRHMLNSKLSTLIDIIIERFGQGGINRSITGYFDIQYSYLLDVISKDLISHLSIEDQFFINLFDKVMLLSARRKVCH